MRGRLRKCLKSWQEIGASRFILNTVSEGYKIPFVSTPPPIFLNNNQSALNHSSFVNEAVQELLVNNCIEELFFAPEIVNPLTVSVQSPGKKRLIIDLRHINLFVYKQKFRCEDLALAKEVLRPNDYLFKFDLKSGYHHVEIFPPHRKFLSFAWNFDNKFNVRYFQFCVLPFGLSSAPYIFTKLLKPLSSSLRSLGVPIFIFLDDGLGKGSSLIQAKINSLKTRSLLLKLGFLPNEEKSVWEPVPSIIWLGYVIDTFEGLIKATPSRIEKFLSVLAELDLTDNSLCMKARNLASIVGQIISFTSCVGNVSRLMSRHLHAVINSAESWNSIVTLNREAVDELVFWKENILRLNGFPIWPVRPKSFKVVYSDASGDACGAFIDCDGSVFHQNWSDEEASKSSTWRELQALVLALASFKEQLSNSNVNWYTDSLNVCSIIDKGSRIFELQILSVNVFEFCLNNKINLEVKWIPRDQNTVADGISKVCDFDDYSVSPQLFAYLDCIWGPFTCDRFSCYYNALVSNYNSRFFQPSTAGVDAFAQDWRFHNNWLHPPIHLIPRVIRFLENQNSEGVLVLPYWPSLYFWNLLCPDGKHFDAFVLDWKVFHNGRSRLVQGKTKISLFDSSKPDFDLLVLRISFKSAF